MQEDNNQNISILVVDDEPDVLKATIRLLHKAGHRVFEARNAEECLQITENETIDLVLLDVVLPDGDGYEVCKKIKADKSPSQAYVVLLSGMRTSSDEQSEGLESGADGYVARPISNRELLARVEAMVRIIRAERERDALILKLQKALAEVKTLSGLLPICMECKNIRNDKGYWEKVEVYIRDRSDADFSHGLCPDCFKTLYPEIEYD